MININQDCENPAMIEDIQSQMAPALKTRYPPYISVKRPHISRVAHITSESAVVGHIVDAAGMFKSLTRMGVNTFDPVM